MLKVIIIEDEAAALENLINALSNVRPSLQVQATLTSVKEGIEYLSGNNHGADLIFSDVQLPDGLSFEIYHATNTHIPVIFITGYDEFMTNAFEYNGIDYLLKPVSADELSKAIRKYEMLEQHFAPAHHSNGGLSKMLQQFGRYKNRIMVRKGVENIPLKLEDVALFYTENKVVYIVDRQGKKYMGDKNLTELEDELHPEQFFRANRQYIINIDYVKGFKAYEKVKLQVDLVLTELPHTIIVSQETAPAFRKWIYEA